MEKLSTKNFKKFLQVKINSFYQYRLNISYFETVLILRLISNGPSE